MNRTMTKINLDASGHSERAARSAARSTTAAEETSRATRVNIQVCVLLSVTDPSLTYAVVRVVHRSSHSFAIFLLGSSVICI